ncbi:unnamed protein product [Didymodactylos carnosus]|uniref:TLDc domain-containing protein n=1 Tax=Didymodactylos carnosus TaxID=1234261 RepID=A0A8S2HCA5_9BILA|nr:unnamed protein product [Didymodactylos carnosus]CAF3627958.1 unnamed protein product [Didymodactylos carnosus]
MAASLNRNKPRECVLCQERNEKGRGVTICAGCSQIFCDTHYLEHRQMIYKQFDRLIQKHDLLIEQQAISQQHSNQSQDKQLSQLVQEIDEWQKEMIDATKNAAAKAKAKLRETLNKEHDQVTHTFKHITNDLRLKQSKRDYNEIDVEEWTQRLEELGEQLNQLQTSSSSKIQLKIDRSIDFANIINIRVIEHNKFISSTAHTMNEQLFKGGTLLDNHQHQLKLNEFCGKPRRTWNLIYKATRDGFDAKNFHGQRDGRNSTITLLQTQKDHYLFGGYTSVPWTSTGGRQQDATAFLFTLTNPHNHPVAKFNIEKTTQSCAVYHHKNYGPIFGTPNSTAYRRPHS